MVLAVGAEPVLLAVSPRQKPRLQSIVDRWSVETILAALQILSEARSRMRGVSHARLLAELALVRVARLENLSDLSNMVERLAAIESGAPASHKIEALGVKKKLTPIDSQSTEVVKPTESPQSLGSAPTRSAFRDQADSPPAPLTELTEESRVEAVVRPGPVLEPAPDSPSTGVGSPVQDSSPTRTVAAAAGPVVEETVAAVETGPRAQPPPLDLETVREVWPELVKKVGAPLSMRLALAEAVGLEEPDVLVIAAKPGYNSFADPCGTVQARERIAHSLQRLLRRSLTVRFDRRADSAPADGQEQSMELRRPELLAADPMIQKVVELFEARPLHLEYDDDPEAS